MKNLILSVARAIAMKELTSSNDRRGQNDYARPKLKLLLQAFVPSHVVHSGGLPTSVAIAADGSKSIVLIENEFMKTRLPQTYALMLNDALALLHETTCRRQLCLGAPSLAFNTQR